MQCRYGSSARILINYLPISSKFTKNEGEFFSNETKVWVLPEEMHHLCQVKTSKGVNFGLFSIQCSMHFYFDDCLKSLFEYFLLLLKSISGK